MRTTLRTAVVVSAATLLAAGCSTGAEEAGTGSEPTDGVTTLRIGASPVPHAEILEFVDAELAEEAGIDLEIETYGDYVLPNTALVEGDLDANFFQHVPYLDSQVEAQGFELTHFDGVHIEPYGVYSERVDSLEDVPQGGTVGITNDPGNQPRALRLLEAAGLLTLAETDGEPTVLDVEDNPLDLELVETAPEQLVRALADVDVAVINGNYALEAGLNPAEDALHLESGEDNPFANVVAYRVEDEGDEALQTLDRLLHSEEVRAFIEERWAAGEIIPAF